MKGKINPNWDEVFQCARGQGSYTKRYRVKDNDSEIQSKLKSLGFKPVLDNCIGEEGLYLTKKDCEVAEKAIFQKDKYTGLDDINNCSYKNQPPISVYRYYNTAAWEEDQIRYMHSKGINVQKTNTKQLLKASFNIQAYGDNVSFLTFLPATPGTAVGEVYQSLFDPNNVKDIVDFQIVFTESGRDQVHNAKKQIFAGVDIHNFYETSIVKASDGEVNNQISILNHNLFASEMAYGIGFINRSNLNTDYTFKKTQFDDYSDSQPSKNIIGFNDGYVPQKQLNDVGCERVDLSQDTYLHYLDNKVKQYTVCRKNNGITLQQVEPNGIPIQTSGSYYLGMNFSDINWANVNDKIDVLNKVKSDQIPFIYFFNDEDNKDRLFTVHFIVSYKQDPNTITSGSLKVD